MWRWLVVAVVLAGCGGVDDGPDPWAGGSGGAGHEVPCYEFTRNPDEGFTETHCTNEASFCWWTGREVLGDTGKSCPKGTVEAGCYSRERGHELFICALVACRPEMIDNAPCCYDTVTHQHDGSTGPWDGVHGALCLE
jgi:hypothetical protein